MNLSLLHVVVLGEVLIVGWLLAIGLLMARLWAGSRARRAARRLVELVSAQKAARSEALKAELISRLGYGEEQAMEKSIELGRAETAFYQAFIDIYLEHDNAAIVGINVPFESVVDAYRSLLADRPAGAPAEGTEAEEPLMTNEEIGRLQADFAALQEERDRLNEELSASMDTMGQMLDEYSNMAASNDGSDVDRGKILSMFQEKDSDDLTVSEDELREEGGESESVGDDANKQPADDESVAEAEAISAPESAGDDELSLDDLEITLPEEEAVAETMPDNMQETTTSEPVDKIAELQLDGDLGPEKSGDANPV